MAEVRGRSEVSTYINRTAGQIEKLLRGAARAGGAVLADEAKDRSASDEVADAIIVRTRTADNRVTVTVTVKSGWTYARALWLEYGTSPHFISVEKEQREGLGLRRINAKVQEAKGDGSLVINGKFVGGTIFHPGARPFPFLRPSLDIKGPSAIAAAQQYINAHVSRAGIIDDSEGDEE